MKEDLENSLIDGHTHIGTDLLFYLRGYYPYCLDWASLVRLGEANGIGRFVVFPMVSNLSMDLSSAYEGKVVKQGGLERVPYAFENRRMMIEIEKLFSHIADRALPLWMLDPSHEQKAQVEALRELSREYRCAGLKIQATIIQSHIRDLLGPGRCLLEYAEENNLSILIHTSVHPQDPWSQNRDILAVVEAIPGVRFCLAHSCRFDKPSLDRVAELPNAWFDCSAHRIHCEIAVQDSPSIAPRDRRFDTDYRDPARALHDLAQAYPGKLIWGSDAPFDSYVDHNLALLSSYSQEVDVLRALDEDTVDAIARQNTLAYLQYNS